MHKHHKYSILCSKEAAFLCPVSPPHCPVGGRGAASSSPALVIWTTVTRLCHCPSPAQGVACYRKGAVWPWGCSIHLQAHCSMTLLWQRCSTLAFLCHTSCEHAEKDKGKHLLFLILDLFCWEPGDGLLLPSVAKEPNEITGRHCTLACVELTPSWLLSPEAECGQDGSCGHCPHLVAHPHQDVSREGAERSLHTPAEAQSPRTESSWLRRAQP